MGRRRSTGSNDDTMLLMTDNAHMLREISNADVMAREHKLGAVRMLTLTAPARVIVVISGYHI